MLVQTHVDAVIGGGGQDEVEGTVHLKSSLGHHTVSSDGLVLAEVSRHLVVAEDLEEDGKKV